MDLRSIRYFVQIAELGSITRASQHLGIAQPALSRHVKSVEDELGTQLLVRLPRGVRLTGAGLQFLEHCRRIVRELGRARDELRTTSEVPRGRVTLGLSPTTGPMLLPGVLERVRRQCPQVTLKVAGTGASRPSRSPMRMSTACSCSGCRPNAGCLQPWKSWRRS